MQLSGNRHYVPSRPAYKQLTNPDKNKEKKNIKTNETKLIMFDMNLKNSLQPTNINNLLLMSCLNYTYI